MLKLTSKLKQVIKKCVVTSLCTAIAVTGTQGITAFADEVSPTKKQDIYARGLTENVDIEGITYTYTYFYDNNGNKSISVTDTSKSKTEVVSFDAKTSKIYIDGKQIGELEVTDDNGVILDPGNEKQDWQLIGTFHNKISWVEGISVAALAAVLTTVMSAFMPVNLLLASCGSAVLGTIASGSVGGTLHWTSWYYTSVFYYHYKYDWSFVAPDGDRFGTYHVYFNLE